MVNYFFNELLNDISHFVVAQNFITLKNCYLDFLGFLVDGNRYKVEVFRVNIF